MIVRELLDRTGAWFQERGLTSPRLDAELLLARVLGCDRVRLYTEPDRPVMEPEVDRFRDFVRRRGAGEPVAYILGRKEFYGLPFKVNADVLVPRPETELLVDRALETGGSRILDLGTGSGCIAVTLAHRLPEAQVVATDVSPRALEVARDNAATNEVGERIRFLEGDLFGPLAGEAPFDLICCNPPYVARGEAVETAGHEPDLALYAGDTGMEVVGRLLREAPSFLAAGGTLLVELAETQGPSVRQMALEAFDAVELHRDLQGHARLLEATGVSPR